LSYRWFYKHKYQVSVNYLANYVRFCPVNAVFTGKIVGTRNLVADNDINKKTETRSQKMT